MSQDEKDKKPGKPGKLEVKGDAFKKLTDEKTDKVSGGRMRAGTTLNPTSSDGCCGA